MMDAGTKKILITLAVLFAVGGLLAVVDFSEETTMEQFTREFEDGADCEALFSIRRQFHPRDEAASVRIANERLRSVGCASPTSERTDQ